MSRTPKKYINTPFFHIMVQGINKEPIFETSIEAEEYLKLIKQTKEEFDLQILSYCMMYNHAHFLIYVEDDEELTKFMHKANLKYAKYYNKKNERVGYVFRDRYKAQPIMSRAHLLKCIEYIHNNPVKAHICNKPENYKYSSYKFNMFKSDSIIEKSVRNFINFKMSNGEDKEEFVFMENEEEDKIDICKRIINDIYEKYNIDNLQLSKNRKILLELIKKANIEHNVSLRMIEQETGISWEKLRKIKRGE